jgi:hypothetical protein
MQIKRQFFHRPVAFVILSNIGVVAVVEFGLLLLLLVSKEDLTRWKDIEVGGQA